MHKQDLEKFSKINRIRNEENQNCLSMPHNRATCSFRNIKKKIKDTKENLRVAQIQDPDANVEYVH